VLKNFIYESSLSAPYMGGISSYGLILMIVAYIQQEYRQHEGKGEELLVADLLIGFLKFYGFKTNYVMKCIQVYDKQKNNWGNYSGCISRYNDPNGMMVPLPTLRTSPPNWSSSTP
jgi:DNA polymerase sigma